MWIPSIKEKIFNILMYGHVPQLPHYKQGCELFTATSRKGTFTSCCPRGKQVACVSESSRVLSLALADEGEREDE